MGEIISVDSEYLKWISSVTEKFKQSQIKAASKVNTEMLKFYFNLGGEISRRDKENNYGSSFYKRISDDLQRELPDVRSFSVTNLKYMTYYYELYADVINRPQPEDDFTQAIFLIPWGHNKLIIDKCKSETAKALFFVKETLENNWSRAVLLNFLDTDLYDRQGKAITNFDKVLPSAQSDLAQEMTKDPYNFDFLTIRKNYDEKELKDALMQNVQALLMELGRGIAFVGREYRLVVGKT